MKKQFLKDGLVWGFVLWFIGYVLGIVLFMFVPKSMIGWFILPIGTIITLFVLTKKIDSSRLEYYFKIAAVWTVMAVVFDYLFLVKLFKPEDGYYKLDVYVYYLLTFVIPIAVGWRKNRKA